MRRVAKGAMCVALKSGISEESTYKRRLSKLSHVSYFRIQRPHKCNVDVYVCIYIILYLSNVYDVHIRNVYGGAYANFQAFIITQRVPTTRIVRTNSRVSVSSERHAGLKSGFRFTPACQ
ncbi:hypothetical protein V1477_011284 [Vespula maculifrons]|uniref:Uncharacterized protein n=1 Tax=Vespula maculifrons TaxID=7453 RepID=A0ABD2C4G5_VESMC